MTDQFDFSLKRWSIFQSHSQNLTRKTFKNPEIMKSNLQTQIEKKTRRLVKEKTKYNELVKEIDEEFTKKINELKEPQVHVPISLAKEMIKFLTDRSFKSKEFQNSVNQLADLINYINYETDDETLTSLSQISNSSHYSRLSQSFHEKSGSDDDQSLSDIHKESGYNLNSRSTKSGYNLSQSDHNQNLSDDSGESLNNDSFNISNDDDNFSHHSFKNQNQKFNFDKNDEIDDEDEEIDETLLSGDDSDDVMRNLNSVKLDMNQYITQNYEVNDDFDDNIM
ncbi:hypothetical protein TRFO_13089 [Tritrichomonas foetus]|uniref:Uncharacterized protein n=1 Tax=Tritrichomonas foetus TaxID=1144522 RepID=A0A1J4L0N0_9EUKA|nr:hypothetical protein TRFO_13089 [Tritrichomonas foetus]|eukprot:OHT16656.1 hypothetical protein TRFO_13089 [Tritrichomonas foetus]